MLSSAQKSKILDDIEDIADDLSITVLPERQRIENATDFPLLQVTFLLEGKRQRMWRDMLHEDFDGVEWTTMYGHIAQATVSVSIRSLDVDELQTQAFAFANAFWEWAGGHWSLESTSKIQFAGTDPPKFLPAYRDVTDRHDIYSCVLDFYVDYEFSWSKTDPPITNIVVNTDVGILESDLNTEDVASLDELYSIAPGCYLMSGIIGGNNSAYRIGGNIL